MSTTQIFENLSSNKFFDKFDDVTTLKFTPSEALNVHSIPDTIKLDLTEKFNNVFSKPPPPSHPKISRRKFYSIHENDSTNIILDKTSPIDHMTLNQPKDKTSNDLVIGRKPFYNITNIVLSNNKKQIRRSESLGQFDNFNELNGPNTQAGKENWNTVRDKLKQNLKLEKIKNCGNNLTNVYDNNNSYFLSPTMVGFLKKDKGNLEYNPVKLVKKLNKGESVKRLTIVESCEKKMAETGPQLDRKNSANNPIKIAENSKPDMQKTTSSYYQISKLYTDQMQGSDKIPSRKNSDINEIQIEAELHNEKADSKMEKLQKNLKRLGSILESSNINFLPSSQEQNTKSRQSFGLQSKSHCYDLPLTDMSNNFIRESRTNRTGKSLTNKKFQNQKNEDTLQQTKKNIKNHRNLNAGSFSCCNQNLSKDAHPNTAKSVQTREDFNLTTKACNGFKSSCSPVRVKNQRAKSAADGSKQKYRGFSAGRSKDVVNIINNVNIIDNQNLIDFLNAQKIGGNGTNSGGYDANIMNGNTCNSNALNVVTNNASKKANSKGRSGSLEGYALNNRGSFAGLKDFRNLREERKQQKLAQNYKNYYGSMDMNTGQHPNQQQPMPQHRQGNSKIKRTNQNNKSLISDSVKNSKRQKHQHSNNFELGSVRFEHHLPQSSVTQKVAGQQSQPSQQISATNKSQTQKLNKWSDTLLGHYKNSTQQNLHTKKKSMDLSKCKVEDGLLSLSLRRRIFLSKKMNQDQKKSQSKDLTKEAKLTNPKKRKEFIEELKSRVSQNFEAGGMSRSKLYDSFCQNSNTNAPKHCTTVGVIPNEEYNLQLNSSILDAQGHKNFIKKNIFSTYDENCVSSSTNKNLDYHALFRSESNTGLHPQAHVNLQIPHQQNSNGHKKTDSINLCINKLALGLRDCEKKPQQQIPQQQQNYLDFKKNKLKKLKKPKLTSACQTPHGFIEKMDNKAKLRHAQNFNLGAAGGLSCKLNNQPKNFQRKFTQKGGGDLSIDYNSGNLMLESQFPNKQGNGSFGTTNIQKHKKSYKG